MAKLLDLSVYGPGHISNILQVDASVYAKAFVTDGGKDTQVVRGDGTLASISSLSVGNAATATNAPWSGITGKPTTFTPSAHTHTASDITGLPTSLKNPYKLTFGSKTYDGSAAATITASDLGALTSITKSMVEDVLTGNITSHTHSQYLTSALRPAKLFVRKEMFPPGYFIIKINDNSEWILSFDVKIVVPDGSYTIRFSEDNSTKSEFWHSPSASMIDGEDSIEVKFGYSRTNKWAAIPAPHSLVGISITNVANGYAPIDTYDLDKLFTIDFFGGNASDLEYLGTVQETITIYPPSKEGHTHTFASLTSKPTTIAGYRITDAYTSSTIDSKLAGYLPLSGGTLTGMTTIKNSSASNDVIYWVDTTNSNHHLGFGEGSSGNRGIYDSALGWVFKIDTSNNVTISGTASNAYNVPWSGVSGKPTTISGYGITDALTTSNYNSYAPTLTGTGASGTWGINITGNAASADYASSAGLLKLVANQNPDTSSIGQIFATSYNEGIPSGGYAHLSGITLASNNDANYKVQLALDYYGKVFSRWQAAGTWRDWNRLAFITDNVASATKLQTPRTIWGQSFDGMGDVNGYMVVDGPALFNNYNATGNKSIASIIINKGGDYFGIGTSTSSVSNIAFGLCNSNWDWTSEQMVITYNGNVLIGTTTDNGYKLQVNGSANATTLYENGTRVALSGHTHPYLPLSGGTMTGAITMNTGTGLSMKYTASSTTGDRWIYPTGADSYGIRYFEGDPDKMTISATGNNTTIAGADLCINGNGSGTVTIRGNTIYHTGNLTKVSQLTNDAGYKTTDTNTWRPVTNTYTGSDQSTCVSQYGTNALYNSIPGMAFGTSVRYIGTSEDLNNYDVSKSGTYSSHDNKTYTNGPGYQNFGLIVGRLNTAYTYQLALPYSTNSLKYRSTCYSGSGIVWLNWRTIIDSDNISSYALTSLPSHTHTKSQITDFPSSMPASDVYSWAKASTKPTYTYSEVGAAAASHGTHLSGSAALYSNSSSGSNCNNVTYNLIGYYTSNGPSTSLGASTNDGSLYSQAYSSSWVSQIAQDYRNGNLFTRGKNNGTWTAWKAVSYNGHTHTKSQITDFPSSLPASDVYSWAKASTKPTYTAAEVGAAAASHTHKYAGSSSAGGAATSVVVTDSNANSTYRMVWHSGNSLYSTDNIYCNPSTDSIYASAFYETSDERLKDFENSVNVDLNLIRSIPKMYFRWKKNPNKLQIGTSAQAVKQIYPELVSSSEDDILSVDYSKLSIVALSAIDKLHLENQDLKHEINLLKKEIEKLKGQI